MSIKEPHLLKMDQSGGSYFGDGISPNLFSTIRNVCDCEILVLISAALLRNAYKYVDLMVM